MISMADPETIKNIIYKHSHKAGMALGDLAEGQILGLKTGPGWELDTVAEALLEYFNSLLAEAQNV